MHLTHVPHGPYSGQPWSNPQPTPLDPDTADFREAGDRVALASLGVFSIDRAPKRVQTAKRRIVESTLDNAYTHLGMSRKETHESLAADLEGGRTGGIWARSTGEYTASRRALDQLTLLVACASGFRCALPQILPEVA